MIARIYLTVVGLLYLALAVWCSFDPQTTSKKVGFELQGGTGRSEFLTVYGGLEFGMALAFLLPWLKPDATEFALLACLVMHASLVVFRSISLLLNEDVGQMTYQLAIGEWVILLLTIACWIFANPKA